MRNGSKRQRSAGIVFGILALAATFIVACSSAGPGGPPPKSCKHSPCKPGIALTLGCDVDCVDIICGRHPSCCGADAGMWRQECADFVISECHQQCDCTKTNVDGDAFNRQSCDCVQGVCKYAGNSCCTIHWTQACADSASHVQSTPCMALP